MKGPRSASRLRCVHTVAVTTTHSHTHTHGSQVCPSVFVALRPWLCGQSTSLISLGCCPLGPYSERTIQRQCEYSRLSELSIITQEEVFLWGGWRGRNPAVRFALKCPPYSIMILEAWPATSLEWTKNDFLLLNAHASNVQF